MQVANTLNNTIRILFNPKIESFRLFDFLIVKSSNERYLAQIIEIYDDKFDSSQNVAKLKLFYKIGVNNEVIPYDNFTPNKECEITKVNAEDVENFVNQDKDTFVFATDVKSSQGLNIQYDFFEKNPIIMADKIENANAISLNLAKNLSSKRHVVLVDFGGIIEFDDAKKIQACKNFKLPLNYNTVDYVFEKCLADASLEFQATGIEILNAIKKFAKKQELGFIPFNAFINVILEQYKATPYPELQLMLARMRKYQMQDIFAKNKKDYETLAKTIAKNAITIIDVSNLNKYWQKAYLEYISLELSEEIYLITRISEETFETGLIDKIYNEKQNIKFIPNASYNYPKLPTIMQYCKNYILMPSLNHRTDFLDANFALSNLISEGCIIFGENTDGFLYIARDYELELQEKRKNYRKIALRMASAEEESPEQEEKPISDSQKLVQELENFEQESLKQNSEQYIEEDYFGDEFQEINQNPETQEIPKEIETIKNIQEIKLSNESQGEPTHISDIVPDRLDVTNYVYKDNFVQANDQNNGNVAENSPQSVEQTEEIPYENLEAVEQQANSEELEETFKNDSINTIDNNSTEAIKEAAEEQNEVENEEIEISDEELDFFELAEPSENIIQQHNEINLDNDQHEIKSDNSENNIIDVKAQQKEENNNQVVQEDILGNQEEDLDLSKIATDAVDENFNDIINSKVKNREQTFEIDENTEIKVNVENAPKENLPIFEESKKEDNIENRKYKIGTVITHPKYGKGTVIKTIQHDQRQLLQIEFENSGKKLLDPKIAEIQIEQ